MQIDWLTVIAQIINFLVLIWLLKRFLYQPVIDAMDKREQRIAASLREAEQREQIAAERIQEYQNKIGELDLERDQMIEEATTAATTRRQELLEEARDEVEVKRHHWQQQVEQEKQDFLRGLRYQAADSIQAIARHALSDLATRELEEQIVENFIQQLETLDAAARQKFASTAETALISTSFNLEATMRAKLAQAIHKHIVPGIDIVYDESPDLLCGIELTLSGRRLSWTLSAYLEQLEQRMHNQLGAASVDGG